MSYVKNPALAEQGRLNLELAERRMGALRRIRERFEREQPFRGLMIGMALHATKETGMLVRTLTAGGARVALTSCNPLSTQDDVAAALAEDPNVLIWAYRGESRTDYYKFLNAVIDVEPHLTIDDGCDLITELHTKRRELLPKILGGCEETTTGVLRLRAMEREGALAYPVIAVNDNRTKHLFDNYYGTGQSTWDGVLRATNVLLAGKTVVIAGYGSCGKGVALRARGLGANVVVTEVDPLCALQAAMDGFRVLPLVEAGGLGDIFITVTGNLHVLRAEHLQLMKDGAILANAGHFDCEIDLQALEALTRRKRRVRPSLDEYLLPSGKVLYIVAEGRLVNLAAAEGHPSEVMSLSFCGQALACEYLVKNRGKLQVGVHQLPAELDAHIARLALEEMNITIDTPTEEQHQYRKSWREGT
jgi:adenosylhomocysteinase